MIKNRKLNAFTLIELLVVIAIIGILAALIIVSLAGARQKALDTQTKNNVRSLGTAIEQYALDQTTPGYIGVAAQVVLSDASIAGDATGTKYGAYLSGKNTSQAFTGYSGVTNGYITDVAGVANKYLLAAGLRSTTEGTVATGNGVYVTSAGGVAGSVSANGLTLTGIGPGALALTNHAFVVYGPQ